MTAQHGLVAIDMSAGPEAAVLQLWPVGLAPALCVMARAFEGQERETFWQTVLTLMVGTIGADLGHQRARDLLAKAIEISHRAEAEMAGQPGALTTH